MSLDSSTEETVAAAETGSSKSQLIRACVAQNPGAGASEIAAKLAAAGTPVSLPLVYQVLRRTGDKPEPKKRGPKPARAAVKAPQSPAARLEADKPTAPADNLYNAMLQFVEAAGGLNRAINILTMLKK